jgi:hypothetical protein
MFGKKKESSTSQFQRGHIKKEQSHVILKTNDNLNFQSYKQYLIEFQALSTKLFDFNQSVFSIND